jgi:membrane protein implicated in regulation of membrane protease activity
MEPWVWWAVIAGLLGVIEIVTGGTLVFLMLAAGAAAGAVVAGATGSLLLAIIAFAGVSAGSLLGVRPVARRHMQSIGSTKSGVAALVGTEAVVLETVTGLDGRIKLAGETWSAKAYDSQSTYAAGSTVHVLEISGATALVA